MATHLLQGEATLIVPRVSVAIPVYNEEAVLDELLLRLLAVLDDLPGGPHQVVFVDDGSTDDSREILARAASEDSRIQVVALSRNFGHQAAISAAFDFADGDVIFVMDADLQDPPEMLPRFLNEYENGFDVVYAIRTKRKENLLLRAAYAIGYRFIARLSSIPLPVGAGDFALLSRRVVDLLRSSKERNRYLRGMRSWIGFRQQGVPVERDSRHAGKSKYTLRRLFGLAFDGVFAFSLVPLRLTMLVGALAVGASVVFMAYAVYAKLVFNQSPQGFTALIVAIVFLGGVQVFFLGIVGEYVGRIYEEVKERPHYIVREVVGRRRWTGTTANDTRFSTNDTGGGDPDSGCS